MARRRSTKSSLNKRHRLRLGKARRLHHETLEQRQLLAVLLGVSPNSGELIDLDGSTVLQSSPTELTVRFDGGERLEADTLDGIRLVRSGGDGEFGPGGSSNDVIIQPGYVGFADADETAGEQGRVVTMRFAETLPDDFYQLQIYAFDDPSAGITGLRSDNGEFFEPSDPNSDREIIPFEIELGGQVVSVVPQPILRNSNGDRVQHRDQVHVFFNEDPLSDPAEGVIDTTTSTRSVVRPEFYNLFFTDDTVENTDDLVFNPTLIEYDPELHRAVLTFANDLADFAPDEFGTFRLRIGSSQPLPAAPTILSEDLNNDVPGTFEGAFGLGANFGGDAESILIRGEVEPTVNSTVRWPGLDSPGTRDNRRDPQVTGPADTTDGINVYYYNFAPVYGTDPFGNVLENVVTEAQKRRTREILGLYSDHLGVQFIESQDRGLQIVTGDLRVLVETARTGAGEPLHEFRLNDEDPTQGVLVMDGGENWYDGYGLSPDERPSWFVEALRGIGSLLGIGHTFDQVPGVASGSNPGLYDVSMFPLPDGSVPSQFSIEPDFLSSSDIIPGRALHRPETRDAELYQFSVAQSGRISIETFAERLEETSLLDTDIKLWKLNPSNGQYDLVARNDDFFSNDSFLEVDVSPNDGGSAATYAVGITASGNENYNPLIADSGSGGRTEGRYEMRVTFQGENVETIVDSDGTPLDGNGDGNAGGDFNFWFRTAKPQGTAATGAPRTLFVDKSGTNNMSAGSLETPFRTIAFALAQAKRGDVVRILPSAGADGQIGTVGDNEAYEIGRGGPNNGVLSDGETFNVPQGVTVMIDPGTLFKLRNTKISVGSERVDEDRSLAALQVLGAPLLVGPDGSVARNQDGTVDRTGGQVIFTSYQDESIGTDTNPLQTTPSTGQWGGIEFRNDFDLSEGRPSWETEGIFLDYVSHANIRYGGGRTSSNSPVVNPLQMLEARPTLIHNTIQFSGDAAMSADPNSFEETNFHAPIFQRADTFTSDYQRVGPEIRGNILLNNSINGLFVRVNTPALGERTPMTVSGRFDDHDITHVVSEVLVLQGQPSGPLLLEERPDALNVSIDGPVGPAGQGTLPVGEDFNYRLTFITARGSESLASLPTRSATVGPAGSLDLTGLPQAPAEFAGRRLYRLDPDTGDYVFIRQLDRNTTRFLDIGETRGGLLSDAAIAAGTNERLFPQFDARLSIDPGMVIKLDQARIEARFGADFYAEGRDGQPIVFTSRRDDTYGAGGTFDTNNDGAAATPQPGNWSGLVFRQGSTASLDHTVIRYAGGNSSVSGGFAEFNPVEILQADVRVANSLFSNNASGNLGEIDIRDGIGFNGESTIFVRGAQPVIVNNVIRESLGAAISVNPDALNYQEVLDRGRSTGTVGQFVEGRDNQGPLIAGNRLDNNGVNGLLIRNEALTTESVWDDTDIVHVVERFVYAWNHHHRSGLRLKSAPDEGLVVKLQDGGALVADRYLNDVEDSIGGTIQVIGQPGFPVALTSIHDDTVGAGFTAAGLPQTDTDNAEITPMPGDWHGIVIRAGANDRNVPFVLETEPAIPAASGLNSIPTIAQRIGSLATSESSSDENRRLGFNVRGTLSQNSDIDVYSFTANGQTEVYLDIDDTNFGLDSVVELIDINGNILAQSNDSFAESSDPSLLVNNMAAGRVLPLFKTGQRIVEGPNPLDAGMRVILPGNSNTENEYFIRVRSSNLGPSEANSSKLRTGGVGQGRSRGQYELSVRLRETDEISGTTIRLSDIRYATDAIDVPASPFDSPLAAESAERLNANGVDLDTGTSFTNAGATDLGSLNESHRRVLRVSGTLGNNVTDFEAIAAGQDIDVFQIELSQDFQEPNIIGENRFVSAVFDVDYADQLGRANTRLSIFDSSGRLILHGLDSNVADDQSRPRQGSDMANLEGGSVGTLDSYIGPVELQVGTYYVVVSSAQMTPEVLNQFFESDPSDTNVRMLPINSVRRIAEEGFNDGFFGPNQNLNTTADLPNIIPLFDDTSIVPYTLEDVRMFVTLDGGLTGSNQTTVVSVDPFTGQLERTIGQFGQPVGDLGMRRDGELFGFSLGPQTGGANAGNTGNYLNISPINAAASNLGDDGLSFRRDNEARNNTEDDPNARFLINAMAFAPQGSTSGASVGNVPNVGDGERLVVVGDRNNSGRSGEVHPDLRQNIVYSMVATNGAATNQGSTNGNFDRNFDGDFTVEDRYGPVSNKVELGIIDVGQFIDSDPEKTGGSVTGIAQNQNLPGFSFSTMFGVTDQGALYSFNTFDRRTVDVDNDGVEIYTGVINTTFHGTVERDPLHSDFFGSSNPPEFSSVTLGPRATESGRYESVFFATTTDGWIYTFHVNASGEVEPAPVLVNGRSAVPVLGAFGNSVLSGRDVTGVAFSIREENPWHETGDRNTPFAVDGPNSTNNLHGVFRPHDDSRIRTSGGASLYFGFEPTGNVADNTLNNDGATGNLAPGGAHGTTVSRPFSLEGVSSADKPTVYFNYFLDVQDDSDYTLSRQQLDSFRVFAAGDDGQWQLVSTSNSFRSFLNADEFDYFAETDSPIQELHQDSGAWRQARVDLSPLAGNKNVQLRFDFSTAGGMQSQFRTSGFLTEIQAVPGTELVDGSTFTLQDSQSIPSASPVTTFEFVRGASLNIVHGTFVPDGQRVTLERSDGTSITLTLTLDPPSDSTEVQFDRSQSGDQIAANLLSAFMAIDPALGIDAEQSQLRAPDANEFRLKPERFDVETLTSFDVPPGALIPDDQFVVFSPSGGNFTFIQLTLGTPVGSSQVQFQPGETGVEIAENIAAALNARNPALEAFADGATVRIFADGQLSLFPSDFSSDSITGVNMPDGDQIPDGQEIVVVRPNAAPLTVTLTLGPPTDVDEVQYSTSDTGADIATAVADALDDLNTADPDPSFNVSSSGVELSLSGGSVFVFDGSVFGLEAPAVLTVPPGSEIPNGQELTLELREGSSITLTLVQRTAGFGEVQYNTSQSGAMIADNIATALSQMDPSLDVTTSGSDVIVEGDGEWTETPDRFGAQLSEIETLANGNIAISYQHGMTSEEVRDSIRESLAAGLGERDARSGMSKATVENFPGYGTNRIRVFEQSLGSNNSAVGFSTFLPGDEFGSFGSTQVSNNGTFGNLTRHGGLNNNVEGVYIDDIVVGFASRGEMVLNAPANRNFEIDPTYRETRSSDLHQPEFPNEILVGGYTVEARGGAEYGVPDDYDPIRLQLNEQDGLGRSFDVNDRLNPGAVTLFAPAGRELLDGDTFVISNGSQSLTFEFDSNDSVASGNVRVPFVPVMTGAEFNHLTDQPAEVARAIRDAINSSQARGVLGITAAGGDSREIGEMSGNRIELFAAKDDHRIRINPSSGRFLLVDMVAAETPYGRESARTLPLADQSTETVTQDIFFDTFARAVVTDYTNGQTDTLVATGKIGDSVGTGFGNEVLATDPGSDMDILKIFLSEDDSIDVDLDTIGWNRGNAFASPRLEIYRDGTTPVLVASSALGGSTAPGETNPGALISGFTAAEDGNYYVVVRSEFAGSFDDAYGEYQLTVRPAGHVTRDVLMTDYHMDHGDTNVVRPQGQLIIESNFISDFAGVGIRATYSGDQLLQSSAASPLERHPGAVAMLRNENTDRLLPGTVITNNLVHSGGGTGILFAGLNVSGGFSAPPVPFGRIVNNTVVGSGSGTGIDVTNGASPTVVNNVITDFNVGLNIGAGSDSTVENFNTFQGNATPASRSLSSQSVDVPTSVSLFQDPDRRIFIPARGAPIIDSALSQLNDRSTFVNTVKEPMGISSSPILAPEFDAFGIPRVADASGDTSGGVGSNVFIDRGAIDRADFVQPVAVLVTPTDFIGGQGGQNPDGDIDPSASFVRLPEDAESVEFFEIQLLDPAGTGPDADTISAENVILTRDGVPLTAGVDYTFGYNDNNRLIRLTPLAGIWAPNAAYEITLNNRDRLSIMAPDATSIADGDQWTVTDASGVAATFEFETAYVLEVPRTSSGEVDGVADGIITYRRANGDEFRIELDSDGDLAAPPADLVIGYDDTTTAADLAVSLAEAFADSPLGLTSARPLENGLLSIGGAPGDVLDIAATGLNVSGAPGVTGSLQLSLPENSLSDSYEGQTVVVSDGTQSVTYEFTLDDDTSAGTTVIVLQPGDDAATVANQLALAIDADFSSLSPQIQNGTSLLLNEPIGSSVDVSNTQISVSGLAGGAIPIAILPSVAFNRDLVAAQLLAAISASPLGATPFLAGGGKLLLADAMSVVNQDGDSLVNVVVGMKDVAGNDLLPNRANEETQFTILMPGVELDFGDAPADESSLAYERGSDGILNPARHTLADARLPHLGEQVDADLANAFPGSDDGDDGVLIGSFGDTPGIFLDPEGDFLGFLNPLDTFGTELTVDVSGSGLLDAWVDFNQDGDWNDPGEQVFSNIAVLPGYNRLRIQTPANAFDGETWARFRLSPTGNQAPQGVVIGGEVEDYVLTVASVQLPVPNDDQYEVDEDAPGGLTVSSQSGVLFNPTTGDTLFGLMNPEAELESDVRFGTLNLAADGSFSYTPNDDFYGTDTFTYRIRGQQRVDINDPGSPLLPVRSSQVGTVTIAVDPVNDAPLVVDRTFTTLEDVDGGLRITAAELLAGAAAGDFDPSLRAPFDESAQTLRITGINENPNDLNALSDPPALQPDGEVEFTTTQGMLVRANFLDGALVDLVYFPTDHYNADNPKAIQNELFDSFTITVYDDGVTVFDDLAGTELDPPLRPAFSIGTVTLDVTPVNDEPIIPVSGPAAVEQQITVLEDSAPYSQPWTPVLPGPTGADDENIQTVTYSLATVSGDAARIFATQPTIDSNGQLNFELAENQNGTVVFEVTPQDDGADGTAEGDDAVGEPVLLTISVTAVNDAPIFNPTPSTVDGNGDIQSIVEVLERDDESTAIAIAWANSIQAGPTSATDELLAQGVTFDVLPQAGNPAGLFAVQPIVNEQGLLIFTPTADAVGTAVFVVTASDDGDSDPALPEDENVSTPVTLTIHVRPVNDAPIFDPAVLGTSEALNSDEAWSVASNGEITFRLREDNTQQNIGPQLYQINLVRQGNPLLYGRIGLLDVFNAGPGNEEDGTLGGSQTLELLSFDLRTRLGGDIFLDVDANNNPVLMYDPPDDVNRLFAGADSFTYTVIDDGETWRLGAGLDGDPLTATNTVSFTLEPVNDAPEFTLTENSVAAFEDAPQLRFEGFATNIFAGPPATAQDEIDVVSGQSVSFSVTARNPADEALAAQLFSDGPRISPDGTLQFTPAPDQYGTIVFDVVMTDDGPDNDIRGDEVSSTSQPLTISIRPQNDAPRFANDDPVEFTLDEDTIFLIPLRAVAGEPQGLLDKFTVGPPNESADIIPGGNQTLALANPVPASTPAGGQLTRVTIDGRSYLRYKPKANFNGPDTFAYSVVDNGVSVDLLGQVTSDPKTAFFNVALNVLPVNDPPQFGGAGSVSALEDAGENNPNVPPADVGLTVINQWATNIQPGPAGAVDELANQTVSFTITPLDEAAARAVFASDASGNLQVSADSDGTLRFRTLPDANGTVVFTVFATDSVSTGANTSSTKTFTIAIDPVNDPPTFTPGPAVVSHDEDAGSYSQPWASDISPGPNEEASVGQTVRFDVTIDAAATGLFQSPPEIADDGTLKFTPAANANGTATVTVQAVDSEGGTSDPVSFEIVLEPVIDTPVANADSFDVDEDTVRTLLKSELLANDVDPDLPDDSLTISLVSNVTLSGASVSLDANNNIVFDPTSSAALQSLAANATTTDTFRYFLTDSFGRTSESVTVSLLVTGINDAPRVLDDNPDVQPAGSTVLRPLDNDVDIDGSLDPSSLQITLQPAFGSIDVRPDGTIVYTPFAGFRGTDTIRYTVADNLGARSAVGQITIASNQAPITVDDGTGTFRNEAVDIDVLSNDSDPDGLLDPASIVIVTQPQHGTAFALANGLVRYVPAEDFAGDDSFTYRVSDNLGRASQTATVQVQVVASRVQNPVNNLDTDADGEISPIDALLIINFLNRFGPTVINSMGIWQSDAAYGRGDVVQFNNRSWMASTDAAIGVPPADTGTSWIPVAEPFLDVDGNQRVEPFDALTVINELNRRARADRQGVSGEAVPSIGRVDAAPTFAIQDAAHTMLEQPSAKVVSTDLVISSAGGSDEDLLDVLARDRSATGSTSDSENPFDTLWRDFE